MSVEQIGGLSLSEIQLASLTRLAESTAPAPDTVRQDPYTFAVSLTWNTVGYLVIVHLKKDGQIESKVTCRQADARTLVRLLEFQVQLQELFAI